MSSLSLSSHLSGADASLKGKQFTTLVESKVFFFFFNMSLI